MQQSQLDHDLYGSNQIAQAELEKKAREEQDYIDMVHAVFSTSNGQLLLDHFNEYLKKPSYIHGSTVEHMHIIEGSKMFVRELLADYDKGKKQ